MYCSFIIDIPRICVIPIGMIQNTDRPMFWATLGTSFFAVCAVIIAGDTLTLSARI